MSSLVMSAGTPTRRLADVLRACVRPAWEIASPDSDKTRSTSLDNFHETANSDGRALKFHDDDAIYWLPTLQARKDVGAECRHNMRPSVRPVAKCLRRRQ